MSVLQDVLAMRQQRLADVQAIPQALGTVLQLQRQQQQDKSTLELQELQKEKIRSQISSAEFQNKFNIFSNLGDVLDVADKSGNIQLRNTAKSQIDSLLKAGSGVVQGESLDSFISPDKDKKDTIISPTSKQVEEQDLIPTEFNKFGEPIKFKSKQTLQDEIKAKKIAETNFKRQVFANDLESFLEVDNQLKRGTGFHGRIVAGLKSKVAALDQSTAEGFAVATHQSARKRLRVQLVRAAGDVGNINIVEQQAAEEMIPREFDAQGTADIKRAFLKQLGKAVDDNSENEVKKVLKRFMETDIYKGPKGEEAEKIIGNQQKQLRDLGFDPDLYEIVEE